MCIDGIYCHCSQHSSTGMRGVCFHTIWLNNRLQNLFHVKFFGKRQQVHLFYNSRGWLPVCHTLHSLTFHLFLYLLYRLILKTWLKLESGSLTSFFNLWRCILSVISGSVIIFSPSKSRKKSERFLRIYSSICKN